MGYPATTGVRITTSIHDAKIGDYIACSWRADTSGVMGYSYNLNYGSVSDNMNYAGVATGTQTFFFVKVDKGLFIADRVVQHSVSWDAINKGKYSEGKPNSYSADSAGSANVSGVLRSFTGGVAYADVNGNKVSVQPNPSQGAYPTNNEWDKYVVNFPADKIASGATLDGVFHWSNVYTIFQDTQIGYSTCRIVRGKNSANFVYPLGQTTGIGSTSYVTSTLGFRPVFEYNE